MKIEKINLMSNEFSLSAETVVIFMHGDATPHFWLGISISKFDLFIFMKNLRIQVKATHFVSHRMTQWV